MAKPAMHDKGAMIRLRLAGSALAMNVCLVTGAMHPPPLKAQTEQSGSDKSLDLAVGMLI